VKEVADPQRHHDARRRDVQGGEDGELPRGVAASFRQPKQPQRREQEERMHVALKVMAGAGRHGTDEKDDKTTKGDVKQQQQPCLRSKLRTIVACLTASHPSPTAWGDKSSTTASSGNKNASGA